MLLFLSAKPTKILNSLLHPPLLHSLSHSPALSSPNYLRTPKPQFSWFLRTIRAIDAAQPYDYESHLHSQLLQSKSIKIAILGFGNFGQFLAKTFIQHGHTVLAHSRSNHSAIAKELGVRFFNDIDDLCEQHPEIVILSTSILSTERVLQSIPFQRLRRNTLFVDVLSVKELPRYLLLKYLPNEFDILSTHPMFGPESGKDSWAGLSFVYDKVRIGNEKEKMTRCENFLNIFAKEGCKMVEMSCADHDKHAAASQFITHMVGRVLANYGLENSPINTKGYETLLDLVKNTSQDSFDLFYGLFIFNTNAMEQLERFDMALETIKRDLFGQLHGAYRKQLFGSLNVGGAREEETPVLPNLLHNGAPMATTPVESFEKDS